MEIHHVDLSYVLVLKLIQISTNKNGGEIKRWPTSDSVVSLLTSEALLCFA